jgi:2,4-dienoyl-CoA reductase-like NADH-dependent reductase (Old Yellow Enzyme family)/NADPH-dependent 2,4-dienoyl-CoA reductase/sulfur reductase-like enzyme
VSELSHLLSPLALGPVELPNRIVSTAHQTTLVHDHLPTEDFVAYHEARAAGGTGLIVMEATAVHESGRLTPHTLAGYEEEIVAGYRRVAEAVKPHGTRLFVQLFHGGRELIASPPRPAAVAPSAIPSQRFHVEPRALDPQEIDEIVAGYARSAELAAEGGLDGVELSAAHGYLFAQFFTPGLNLREDEWAAGPQLLLTVVRALREAAPGLALGVRLSADSEAAASVAPELAELVDFVSIALGDSSTYRGSTGIVPPPPIEAGAIAGFAAPFRVGPPLIATSRIVDPLAADRLIADGVAEAVGMTRALITDPDLPRKAAEGRAGDVLRCIGCNTCIAHYHAGLPIACAQNPRTGRERTWTQARVGRRQRVAVVGAGPAGMAAAAEAHAAGHDVVLYESTIRLGGQVALAEAAPGHAELATSLLRNYERLLEGVDVRLGEHVEEPPDADAVILATGARPFVPDLPTSDGVGTAWDILRGGRPEGTRVVVADWGGDASGLDAAEVLAANGYEVALAVGSAAFGETLHQYQRNLYAARLYRAGIEVWHHLELASWDGGRATFTNIFAPELEAALRADALVLALGRVPVRDLSVQGAAEAGDRLAPRSLEEAILEGSLAGRGLA